MILIDANLLIYAQQAQAPHHEAARDWLDGQINGGSRVGLPWLSLLAFLRITTNPRIFPKAQTMAQAWKQVEVWLSCDNVWIPEPSERHPDIFSRLLLGARTARDLTSDAHLAAIAIEHGLTLCSTDHDFARFTSLRWVNPLTL